MRAQTIRHTRKKKNTLEDDHQIALFEWAQHCRLPELPTVEPGVRLTDYLIHIPNGGKRGKAEAGRFKAMGVKRGVSDLLLPIPHRGFAGLWIEMKAPYTDSRDKNYPSKEQKEWLARMQLAGYQTAVCYGWLNAKMTIQRYLWSN